MKYEVLVMENMVACGPRTNERHGFNIPPMAMWTEVFDNEFAARAYIEKTGDAMHRDEQKDPGLVYTFMTIVYPEADLDLKYLPIVEFDN